MECRFESGWRYAESKRWYKITGGITEVCENTPKELSIVNENEVLLIKKANEMIYAMSDDSGQQFHSFEERLEYVKSILPPGIVDDDE